MAETSMVFSAITEDKLVEVAMVIREQLATASVWLFRGELGAGKTTLIKVVGAALGVEDSMSSPSFAIVNEYRTVGNLPVYHFDFYRLKSEEEAIEIGVEEYLYSGYPCFIEWPDKVLTLIPERWGEVKISIEEETRRTIVISVHAG